MSKDLEQFLEDCKQTLGDNYFTVREGNGPEDSRASVILSIIRIIDKLNKIEK